MTTQRVAQEGTRRPVPLARLSAISGRAADIEQRLIERVRQASTAGDETGRPGLDRDIAGLHDELAAIADLVA